MGSRRGDIQHSMLQVLQKVTSSLGGSMTRALQKVGPDAQRGICSIPKL